MKNRNCIMVGKMKCFGLAKKNLTKNVVNRLKQERATDKSFKCRIKIIQIKET